MSAGIASKKTIAVITLIGAQALFERPMIIIGLNMTAIAANSQPSGICFCSNRHAAAPAISVTAHLKKV